MRLCIALFLLLAIGFAHADVYLLMDGSRHEGIAVENGDQVTITTFDGKVIKVAKKDIRGNIPEPKRNEYFTRLKQLKDTDAKGRVELAAFCQKNNLKQQATELLEAALKIEPANAEAGAALGYVLIDGKYRPAVDPELKIGTRPAPKMPEAPREIVQALQKRLEKTVIEPPPAVTSPDAAELVASARENPSAAMKLLIPPQFPGALQGVKPEIRTRAAWLAGMAQDRRAMDALVTASIYDPEETVRFAAAKALPMLEEPVAIRKLMDIALSPDNQHQPWVLRKVACAALRRYGSQEVIERLMKELSFELAGGNPRDPKNRMRGQGIGVASGNPLGVADTNLEYGVPDTDLYPVLSAVKEVTGKTFDKNEKDMKTWIAWWRADGQNFVFKD